MKTCKSYGRAGKGNDARTAGLGPDLGELLRQHASQARGFAHSLTGNATEADELVQQASCRALKHWHRYEPLRSFKSWYLTIVKNVFKDSRNTPCRSRTVSLDAPLADHEDAPLAETIADGEDGPAALLERGEALAAVYEALAALSRPQRMVFRLCVIEGMDYAEAALRLGIPDGTVRSRLFRACAALRANPRLREWA